MKILNFDEFLKEDSQVLFSGQQGSGNISTRDNIFTVGQVQHQKKLKQKKNKLPSTAFTQQPVKNPQSYINRLLQ